MKKKVISVLLVGAMASTMIAGCGSNGNTNSGSTAGDGTEVASDGTEFSGDYSNKQIIIGDQTETSGDYTPMWTNNASDYSVYKMVTGLATATTDADGKWIYDDNVVKNVEETKNDDGTETWTYTINDGLVFSDGTPITAENYVAYYLLWGSDEMISGLEASQATASAVQYAVGFDAYSNGESDTFEGVHLIDDSTFSVTVSADWLPYYYGKALTSVAPEYLHGWVPEDVTIEETENGAKFSDNYTSDYIADTVNEWRYHPTAFSGPYMLTSYDENAYAYTLTKNPNFPGLYDGQTANIETVIYKYVPQDTMLDQLKTGAIDVLLQCADGDSIDAGLDLVDEGGFDYINYARTGYGMLSFKCNQGPTQFEEVRQAVAYLLDRNAFAQTFTGGHGTVVNGPYGLSQWMVEEYADELDEDLNSYNYSLDKAIEVLENGGWVYNEDGSDYSGEGIRYKKLDDGTYMPLVIEWFSSENNSVSDLLVTSLQQNPDVEAAGMQINQTVGSFNDLIKYYYDNSEENPYQMFNLANGFGNPYDVAYAYEPGSDSNTNAIDDQELYDLAVAMNQTEEGDDEAYGEAWLAFMKKWNELMPEVPLYSNDYHDFFSTRVHDFDEDGYNRDISTAVLYINVE